MEYELTAIGELLIDFAPKGRDNHGLQLFAASPGGAPANVCAMFAKLGGTASFIGKVGDDHFGHLLKNTLLENGIGTASLILDSHVQTSLAFVTLGQGGERDFSFYRRQGADTMLRADELDPDLIRGSRILHFGSVSLTDEPCRSTTFSAVQTAREAGCLISCDPNYRPPLWQNGDEARKLMLEGVSRADILKVSEEEMVFLAGQQDMAAGSKTLAEFGPSVVLVTRGAEGVFCRVGDRTISVPAFPVNAIDTTGAGDTFMGTFLYFVKDMQPDQIKTLPEPQLRKILLRCNAASAITTTGIGAIASMPDLGGIRQLLLQNGIQITCT